MKTKTFLKVLGCIFVVIVTGILSIGVVHAKQIQLTWVSLVSKDNNAELQEFDRAFIQRVNEKAKGELIIKYRGGPETIPAFDQGKAVQKGVVDISIVPYGFYEPLAPGIGGAMLTQVSLEEERKPGGGYDLLNEIHKKGGLF